MADRLGWLPGRTGLLVCLLTGFVLPYLGPIAVVRYCPDEARYSFPFVYSKDFLETGDVTMLVGLLANTMLVAAVILAIVVAARLLPRPDAVEDWLRSFGRGVVPLLVAGAFFVVFLGVNEPSFSLAVRPGHVDTPACAHVSGHTFVNNWWGPERFSLLSLKRIGLV